jgi:hypothetical protein
VRLLAYGVVLAAVVVLVWPGSRAGQAVAAVTGSLAGALRSGPM